MRRGMKLLRAALLMAAVALLATPASALAAPANDFFADREVLTGTLPIEVPRSNVEATPEGGESISPYPYPAGHSIWFEWEATATDWVSVGLCGTQFPTILNVFTGTEVDELVPVLGSNGPQGPECAGEERAKYTFKATSGVKYVIVVDGNSYFPPEAPKPVTEGEVLLQIEETQPPSNDDFADAEPIVGQINEEPDGERIYSANARGHNWKATVEPGEPSYGAGAGASVWYEWTAPAAGTYSIFACCESQLEWAIYSGDSMDDLTQLFIGSDIRGLELAAGTNLKIAVFGAPDAATGEPTMGSLSLLFMGFWPPLPKPSPDGGPPPPLDVTPPDTTIVKSRLSTRARSAQFWFSSTEPASGFLCKLDKGPFKACGSPRSYRKLKPGRHTFKVKSIDMAGNVDAMPAVKRIRLPERQRRR